jgi:hypothetical protein
MMFHDFASFLSHPEPWTMVRQECFNPEGLAQRAIRNVKQAAVGLARNSAQWVA